MRSPAFGPHHLFLCATADHATSGRFPPSELQLVARQLSDPEGLEPGSDAHLRSVLDFFDLKRLTVQVGTTLLEVLDRRYSYVDEVLGQDHR